MSVLRDARMRVAAVLDEIDRLKQSEFPYQHPSHALSLLEQRFKRHQAMLLKTPEDPQRPEVLNACRESLRDLHVYVPLLGFVLRATNVRNAFEAHDPLQRLAHRLMGESTRLIVSSEWEFSPFVYRTMAGLPGFVLIGLPAPESSNPLLLPLAGHELGHSVWEHRNVSSLFVKQVNEAILDVLTTERWEDYHALNPHYTKDQVREPDWVVQLTWRPAFTWVLLQMEETFCDFFGLRLFGESYLYAFAYFMSPGPSGERLMNYPTLRQRVSQLAEAADKLGLEVPNGYESAFRDETEPSSPTKGLLPAIADRVFPQFVNDLFDLAKDVANDKQIPMRDAEKVKELCDAFDKWVVPIREWASLSDILNAGWECARKEILWRNATQIKDEDRPRVLRDIVLKSMEIAEVYERLEKPL